MSEMFKMLAGSRELELFLVWKGSVGRPCHEGDCLLLSPHKGEARVPI